MKKAYSSLLLISSLFFSISAMADQMYIIENAPDPRYMSEVDKKHFTDEITEELLRSGLIKFDREGVGKVDLDYKNRATLTTSDGRTFHLKAVDSIPVFSNNTIRDQSPLIGKSSKTDKSVGLYPGPEDTYQRSSTTYGVGDVDCHHTAHAPHAGRDRNQLWRTKAKGSGTCEYLPGPVGPHPPYISWQLVQSLFEFGGSRVGQEFWHRTGLDEEWRQNNDPNNPGGSGTQVFRSGPCQNGEYVQTLVMNIAVPPPWSINGLGSWLAGYRYANVLTCPGSP